MTARSRFLLSTFRILAFLLIAFGWSPVSVSGQEALAKKPNDAERKYCWKCTCPYHADGNKKRKGTWRDEGSVETEEDDRGQAEVDAHEKCEREATGKDCYRFKCSCTGPKRRRHCN